MFQSSAPNQSQIRHLIQPQQIVQRLSARGPIKNGLAKYDSLNSGANVRRPLPLR